MTCSQSYITGHGWHLNLRRLTQLRSFQHHFLFFFCKKAVSTEKILKYRNVTFSVGRYLSSKHSSPFDICMYLFFFFLYLNHCNCTNTVALCHMGLVKLKLRLVELKFWFLSHSGQISSTQRCSKYDKVTAYDSVIIERFYHPRKFSWAVRHYNARSTRRFSLVCSLMLLHI